MTLTVYLAGQIHDDWRQELIAGAKDRSLDLKFVGPQEEHARSDAIGEAMTRAAVVGRAPVVLELHGIDFLAPADGAAKLTFASATQTEMKEIELAQGVDTDAELSHLMLIEQAYAANARMLETVDEMMQQLLRI